MKSGKSGTSSAATYTFEVRALGPEAELADNILQSGIADLLEVMMTRIPQMTEGVGIAVIRALLLNASAAAIRLDMPEDRFMRLVRGAFNLARTTTREVDAEDDN